MGTMTQRWKVHTEVCVALWNERFRIFCEDTVDFLLVVSLRSEAGDRYELWLKRYASIRRGVVITHAMEAYEISMEL